MYNTNELAELHSDLQPKFTEELTALLDKYNATIMFDSEGDTHGVHDERFMVSFLVPQEDSRNMYTDASILVWGVDLSAEEIRDQ